MIFGVSSFAIGYAVFYWGLHHMPGYKRYSLFELLAINKLFNVSIGMKPPVQLGDDSNDPGDSTQPQQGSNDSSSGGLTLKPGASWQKNILSNLGAPTSQNNIQKLTAWNACEGNASGKSGMGINNPFNTTLGKNDHSQYHSLDVPGNTARVQVYPTLALGLQATVDTLKSPKYAAVVANLRNDGSASAFATAVGTSGWGTKGSCIHSRLG